MRSLVLLLTAICITHNAHSHIFHKFKTVRLPVPVDADDPLILTPLIEAGQIEEARKESLVNYPNFKNVSLYTGYLQVDKEFDNNLFFYFFPSENDFENDPLILWLQGGPGAPAGFGLFVENGPFIINQDYTVDIREYRWTKNHSVLYIDNPVGTGFSFTTRDGYAQNQTKVGQDLYSALTQFFTLFPELQSNDFFITGESYGGKYVPAIGYTILQNNPSASLKINLKGLATGNGLSDPINQANYGDYVYQVGLADANTRDILHEYQDAVKKYIAEEDWANATEYFDNKMNGLIEQVSGVNIYNYVQLDPDEEEYWQTYIQEQLRDPLHIGNIEFNSGPVFENLANDIAKSVAPWISELLSNYRFLVYNGQTDIIVAYPLTANYLQNLDFDSAEVYKTAQRQIWDDTKGIAGYYKKAGNLTELLIRDAGHMVPVNQPKRAYMMIYSFARDEPFPKDL